MKKFACINAFCHRSGWYAAQHGNLVPPVQLRKAISSITKWSTVFPEFQWGQGLLMAALASGAHWTHNAIMKGLSWFILFSHSWIVAGACPSCSGYDEIKSDSICIYVYI